MPRPVPLTRVILSTGDSGIFTVSSTNIQFLSELGRLTLSTGLNNSISGPGRPLTLSPQDISTYHLSDDSAFDNRSRLASVSPENQISTTSQSRLNILRPPSLASYLQILDLWGAAARLAVNKDTRRAPPRSERFVELLRRLEEWDQNRPLDQAFAASLLPGYRNQFLDLVSRWSWPASVRQRTSSH